MSIALASVIATGCVGGLGALGLGPGAVQALKQRGDRADARSAERRASYERFIAAAALVQARLLDAGPFREEGGTFTELFAEVLTASHLVQVEGPAEVAEAAVGVVDAMGVWEQALLDGSDGDSERREVVSAFFAVTDAMASARGIR